MVTAMVTAMESKLSFRIGPQGLLCLSIALGCVAFPAIAEDWQASTSPSTVNGITGATANNASLSSTEQMNNSARGWKITPTASIKETATDNVALSNTNKQNDLITDINPGIRIDGAGGRTKLQLDYQLHNLIYAQDSTRNRTQNSLNALGTIEALENWFFIEASGVISQQSISAFGGTTSSSVNPNVSSNTTETSTYRLSPYFRGTLGSFASYQLRYNLTSTNSKANAAYSSDINELTGSLKGVTSLTDLVWSLDGSSRKVEFGTGRTNEADQLRGVLTYQVDPQLRFSLIGGREANDYLSEDKKATTTHGAGFDWSPTERTNLSASREKRFFGDANSINFSHRTAGSAWKYTESKDARVLPTQQSSVGLGTFYDLASTLCSSNLPAGTSAADLATCASNLLGGIPPNTQVPGGFMTSGVTLYHRREMSFALLGARNTVTFTAFKSESENLSQAAGTGMLVGTDFANVNNIKQRGASINWSHKLTAISSLIGSYALLNSKGSGTSSLETDQKLFNVNLQTQLGPKTNAVLGVRRVIVDGTTNYTENALTGMLSHQF